MIPLVLTIAAGFGLGFPNVRVPLPMRRVGPSPDDGLAAVGDLVLLGLLAGMPFITALEAAGSYVGDDALATEVRAVVRSAHRRGTSAALAAHQGRLSGLLRLAARAATTGAPLGSVVAGFTAEVRERQRAGALADAKRLSVRLLFPLALLILPGFVVLVAGPVMLDGLGRLAL